MHSVNGFEVLKNYEHRFYNAFKLILVELEGEELIIRYHNFGMIENLDKYIVHYRETIKKVVKEIKKESQETKELQNTI